MRFRSPLIRVVAITVLLATLFVAGFLARLASRVEAPLAATNLPLEMAPLVALPLVYALTRP